MAVTMYNNTISNSLGFLFVLKENHFMLWLFIFSNFDFLFVKSLCS